MVKVSSYIAPVYFIIFSLSFGLVMLNMFVAIIAVYYKETVKEMNEEEKESSLLKMIENELKRALNEEINKIGNGDVREAITRLPLSYKLYAKILSIDLMPEENEVKVRHEANNNQSNDESSEEFKVEGEIPNTPLIQAFLQQTSKSQSIYSNEKSITLLEQTKPVFWLNMLEAIVMNNSEYKKFAYNIVKYSQQSLLHIDFYPKLQIDNLSAKVKDFVFCSKRSKEQINKWIEADLETKYNYYCGLESLYSESYSNERNQEHKESESSEKSEEIEESSLSDKEPQQLQLAPPIGGITLEGMFQSPEYKSNYAMVNSLLEWRYWNDMKIEDKLAMWIFYFTGKQRVKLWKRMQFSKEGMSDYLNKNGIEQTVGEEFERIWVEDLVDSKSTYKHKIDLLNCIYHYNDFRFTLQ